jgi:hypothetical protein
VSAARCSLARSALASCAAAILAATLACGCGAVRPTPTAQAPEYPGTLTSPSLYRGDFLRSQKLVARYGGRTSSFSAVLQKQGDTLTVIGLTPFGSKAFVIRQVSVAVEFTSYVPGALPFPPRYVLFDIHRVYFGGLGVGPLSDGEHIAERDGESIREVWKGGRLFERAFTRLAADPPGAMVISYEGGMAPGVSPARIEIDNEWVGYQLSIATLSEERL